MVDDHRQFRLGLDLGTNSIGWAAVEVDENGEPCGLMDMGVRIFPDGRNPGDGPSLAANRRVPRGQRRRRDRYVKRRSILMKSLVECDLMPASERERKSLASADPYTLRARALDHALMPFELGRVLFHLNQRRGFKSNRKAVGDDESEAKKTRDQIDELRRRMSESGARTLGEYLATRRMRGGAVRARHDTGIYPASASWNLERSGQPKPCPSRRSSACSKN